MVSGLAAAYDVCERTARAHYENFPVASVLVPSGMRRHIAAVYAFARAADDFADEGARTPQQRYALLDGWRSRLGDAATGVAQRPAVEGEPAHAQAIFTALAATIEAKTLPVDLFEDLLSAFRQDVVRCRYESWDELIDYCRRSANPVGRLVLRIADYRDVDLDRWSDAVCTALQLTNFWQDVGIDSERGRIYIPLSVARRYGAREEELAAGEMSDAWRAALGDVVRRTRVFFEAGRPVCNAVRGRLRYELRATWLGGTRILDRLESSDLDPVRRRPTLGAPDAVWLAWNVATWGRR